MVFSTPGQVVQTDEIPTPQHKLPVPRKTLLLGPDESFQTLRYQATTCEVILEHALHESCSCEPSLLQRQHVSATSQVTAGCTAGLWPHGREEEFAILL